MEDGFSVGTKDGRSEGWSVGTSDGVTVGLRVGELDRLRSFAVCAFVGVNEGE